MACFQGATVTELPRGRARTRRRIHNLTATSKLRDRGTQGNTYSPVGASPVLGQPLTRPSRTQGVTPSRTHEGSSIGGRESTQSRRPGPVINRDCATWSVESAGGVAFLLEGELCNAQGGQVASRKEAVGPKNWLFVPHTPMSEMFSFNRVTAPRVSGSSRSKRAGRCPRG